MTSYQVRLLRHPAFRGRVDTSAGVHGCWPWLRCRVADGYGRARWDGKVWWTHRLARFVAFGDLPEAVCHHCDNPPCVNPEHLRSGTLADNCAEMWAKGRERVYVGPITPAIVAAIRAVPAGRGRARALDAIAASHGFSRRTAYRVINGEHRSPRYRAIEAVA